MDETEKAIEKAKLEIKAKTQEVLRKISIKVMQAIVLATPVDTGRARGNWFVSLGKPTTKTRKNAKDKTGGAIIAENTGIITSAPEETTDIHISNNLPYIVPLNEGHSAQAPAGYVEKALQVAKNGL